MRQTKDDNIELKRHKTSTKINKRQISVELNEIAYMRCIRQDDSKIVFALNRIDDIYAYVDKNDEKHILIEIYIYLDKSMNMFDSWASVGWDFAPIVIDIIN